MNWTLNFVKDSINLYYKICFTHNFISYMLWPQFAVYGQNM
jgi:hypothetical protein